MLVDERKAMGSVSDPNSCMRQVQRQCDACWKRGMYGSPEPLEFPAQTMTAEVVLALERAEILPGEPSSMPMGEQQDVRPVHRPLTRVNIDFVLPS